MPTDPDCIFCKIVDGRLPAAKVLQTHSAVAFLDIQPLAPGHLLLIPPAHYATLGDVPADLLSQLAAELPRLARALLQATGAAALTVACNNGKEAGQLVNHVHFHLIPRRPNDGLVNYAAGMSQPQTQRQALCAKIVAALQ